MWTPALTTGGIDAGALGEAAVRLLLARIDAPGAAVQRVVLPARLVVRESTGVIGGGCVDRLRH